MAIAIGRVGMDLSDVYDMEPDEIGLIVKEWAAQREEAHRDSWERARFVAHCVLTPYSKKKRLQPTDIVRFSWEEPERGKKATSKDIERMKRKYV